MVYKFTLLTYLLTGLVIGAHQAILSKLWAYSMFRSTQPPIPQRDWKWPVVYLLCIKALCG